MTTIQTDNPLVQLLVWGLDITWQYWYIWLVVLILAIWLIARYFDRRQKEWDKHMLQEQQKFDEFKDAIKKLQQSTQEDSHYEIPFNLTGDGILQVWRNIQRRQDRNNPSTVYD